MWRADCLCSNLSHGRHAFVACQPFGYTDLGKWIGDTLPNTDSHTIHICFSHTATGYHQSTSGGRYGSSSRSSYEPASPSGYPKTKTNSETKANQKALKSA